jgi:hypothetical protein
MLTAGITLLFIGAGVCALATLIDTACRIPRLLDELERERRRLSNVTPYTGPLYNRHDREIEA